jgi:hypothetical protein
VAGADRRCATALLGDHGLPERPRRRRHPRFGLSAADLAADRLDRRHQPAARPVRRLRAEPGGNHGRHLHGPRSARRPRQTLCRRHRRRLLLSADRNFRGYRRLAFPGLPEGTGAGHRRLRAARDDRQQSRRRPEPGSRTRAGTADFPGHRFGSRLCRRRLGVLGPARRTDGADRPAQQAPPTPSSPSLRAPPSVRAAAPADRRFRSAAPPAAALPRVATGTAGHRPDARRSPSARSPAH